MKKIMLVLVSFTVAVLIGVGNAFAQDNIFEPPPLIPSPYPYGPPIPNPSETPPLIPPPHSYEPPIPNPSLGPNWKLASVDPSNGTTGYFNTKRITFLPGGIVKVWKLEVPKGGIRRMEVGSLKMILRSKKRGSGWMAERLWYIKSLDEINCEKHKIATVERIYYSFGQRVLTHFFFPLKPEYWDPIYHGSVGEAAEKYVCNGVLPSIPEPSLSSKWKLVAKDSDGTTFYINTRSITHLPGGIVKVRVLRVPRRKDRWKDVNALKNNLLSKGENPSYAKSLWYEIFSDKFNCKTHLFAPLGVTDYSFKRVGLDYVSFRHEEWMYIPTGSVGEAIERYVCKEHK